MRTAPAEARSSGSASRSRASSAPTCAYPCQAPWARRRKLRPATRGLPRRFGRNPAEPASGRSPRPGATSGGPGGAVAVAVGAKEAHPVTHGGSRELPVDLRKHEAPGRLVVAGAEPRALEVDHEEFGWKSSSNQEIIGRKVVLKDTGVVDLASQGSEGRDEGSSLPGRWRLLQPEPAQVHHVLQERYQQVASAETASRALVRPPPGEGPWGCPARPPARPSRARGGPWSRGAPGGFPPRARSRSP